jgi:hypothetical protein
MLAQRHNAKATSFLNGHYFPRHVGYPSSLSVQPVNGRINACSIVTIFFVSHMNVLSDECCNAMCPLKRA